MPRMSCCLVVVTREANLDMKEPKLSDHREWAQLIVKARNKGLSKEEIRHYLYLKSPPEDSASSDACTS